MSLQHNYWQKNEKFDSPIISLIPLRMQSCTKKESLVRMHKLAAEITMFRGSLRHPDDTVQSIILKYYTPATKKNTPARHLTCAYRHRLHIFLKYYKWCNE